MKENNKIQIYNHGTNQYIKTENLWDLVLIGVEAMSNVIKQYDIYNNEVGGQLNNEIIKLLKERGINVMIEENENNRSLHTGTD